MISQYNIPQDFQIIGSTLSLANRSPFVIDSTNNNATLSQSLYVSGNLTVSGTLQVLGGLVVSVQICSTSFNTNSTSFYAMALNTGITGTIPTGLPVGTQFIFQDSSGLGSGNHTITLIGGEKLNNGANLNLFYLTASYQRVVATKANTNTWYIF